MEYKSIFDFLKDDEKFDDIYEKCIEVEKSIIQKSSNAIFILGRSVSEDLIKLIVKDNPTLSRRFFKKNPDGSMPLVSLHSMINACKDKKLISRSIYDKYHKIKKWGNATVHGDNTDDFINEFEKEHKMLFDISLHCYNKFNYTKDIQYEYYLDNYDFKIETYEEQRLKQINSIHFTEVNQENLIESFESKNIFIPIKFFNNILNKYSDKLNDKDKFEKDLKEYEYIDDENLNIILDYFDESIKDDLINDIHDLHDDLSKDTLKTLNNLNKEELTFKELNFLIDNSEDENQKQIYSYIKSLADDLVKNHIIEYKKEIETSPITEFSENGRKFLNYKNYNIIEDDFGFSLEEVDENIFLDENQNEAVEYDGDKPLVIDAGPGSGKTRVIIERVVHLIDAGKKPETILVITFTRKATQELRERLINETDLDLNDINLIRISTVHGFCRYLIGKYEPIPYNYLTRHGERSLFFKKYKSQLGFEKYAFLYDQWIPTVLRAYDEYFSFNVNTPALINYIKQKMEPFKDGKNKEYRYYIDNFYRNNDISECPEWSVIEQRHFTSPSYYYKWLNVADSYPKYLQLMEEFSTCDDNTVLSKANKILENEFILHQIQYKNILIDEFQDTDHIQYEIFKKLLKISETFTIVGDIDQSIYGWRGAYPESFEKFRKNDVKYIILSTNYRSSRNIVEFNEELINRDDDEKELKSKKKYKAPIYQLHSNNAEHEASNIVSLITKLMADKKVKYYSDIAILFRTNKSIDALIKPLESAGIDYYLKENNDFLDQTEVKAMLILFWYLMPFEKTKLPNLGDNFLNFYGLGSDIFDDIFRLSDNTKNILKNIQDKYEENLIRKARSIYSFKKRIQISMEYKDVFELEESIKKEVFESVDTFDIGLLDKKGLMDLGIINESDLSFFLKLNNLKLRMFGDKKHTDSLTTLKIYYELLNITDYFSEISIENNPDDLKVKDNLALFSHIIQDYESIMGAMDYIGLFTYLSRVLTQYSCRQSEIDEGFNKVHLLSIHSAKGLEYPVVIVGSIKQGLCPLTYNSDKGYYCAPDKYLKYKDDDYEKSKNRYEAEELRIIYVASTRAKEILILSTIGENSNDVPEFLARLKNNSKTKIKLLEPYNVSIIPKIESSKVFKLKNDFPKVNFEDIIDDFIYCGYRYDLACNTRFKVRLRNDKYVNMVLHKLLRNIHENKNNSPKDIDDKINAIITYHNIGTSYVAYNIIKNVKNYWMEWGKNYEVIDSDIKILTQLKYCDLTSVIDLVIKEEDKLSVVHFIGSDSNIPDLDMYKAFLIYYIYILKQFDEYKDFEFNKVYLHSLENNKRYELDYTEDMEMSVLQYLDICTSQINENEFIKDSNHCDNCEYYGNVCRGG